MSTEIKAQNSMALASVKAIYDAAEEANTLLDGMQTAAEEAGTTLNGIYADAEQAKTSADNAKQSADTAFKQLSVVEDIVGVLDLIAKNGEYARTTDPEAIPDKWYFTQVSVSPPEYAVAEVPKTYALTQDTEIDPNKTYYTRSGTAPDYVYTPVTNPVVEDISNYYEAHKDPTGLYELVDIKQSIENYVSSHLVLDPKGLWLRPNDGSTQIHISTVTGDEGVIIYGPDSKILAKYGSTAIIGDKDGFHLEIGATTGGSAEIGFYLGTQKVAYLNSTELYVQNSLSFGNFAFIQRANGHFTLKLIGD